MSKGAGGGAAEKRKLDAVGLANIHLHRIDTAGPLTVWLVDGRLIRDKIWIDFTTGGNPEAYPWMPKDEIWIDDDTGREEVRFDMIHELAEYLGMKNKGMDYDSPKSSAHDRANADFEKKARANPKETEAIWDGLVKELTQPANRKLSILKRS
jgi:hypothetical protein